MKWYSHGRLNVNLDLISFIIVDTFEVTSENRNKWYIQFYEKDKNFWITFDTKEQCDEEFQKIKAMMSFNERYYTSCGC